MAYHMTCEEVLAEVWRENDEEYSSFEGEGEEDDNIVYGYPNDRSGRLFGELSSDEEMDAITQNVNNNQDLNNGDHMRNNLAPNIVFFDEQDVANVRQEIVDNEDKEAEVGLGTRVVLDLTHGYENQGYIVVTDNFYTSPTRAQKLLQKGINSLGTVKGNTRGLLKELVFPQKPKPARGSSSWRTCGKMLAVSLYDNKPAYFLGALIHKPLHAPDTPQANKEIRRRSKQGVVQVPCPTVLKDYNEYMCGIDRADQNNRYYSAERNCKHWPAQTVFHQLEISINNAFQLYKAIPTDTQKLSLRDLLMTPATNLMMSYKTKTQAIG